MTPEESAQARDDNEELAFHVMTLAAVEHEKRTEAAGAALEFAAKAMALAILIALLASMRRKAGEKPGETERTVPTDAQVDDRATRIVTDARNWTEGHAETLKRRAETRDEPTTPRIEPGKPEKPGKPERKVQAPSKGVQSPAKPREPSKKAEETVAPTGTEDPWRRQAANTLATRHAAEAVIQIGTEVDSTLRKVWISRGDSKVRPLHRKLHGQHAELNGDFWRWPASGRSLGFPGDPRAPLDQVINCRCILILVPAAAALNIPSAFEPADFGEESFPLAASVPAQLTDLERVPLPDSMASGVSPLPSTRKAT